MNKTKLRKIFPLLTLIKNLTEEDRRVLLCYLNYDGCDGIYACVSNILENPTYSKAEKEEIKRVLSKQKKKYRCLISRQEKVCKKHKTLQQVDGIGFILTKVLPLLDKYLNK
jgi:hypothetical protein